MVSKQDLAYGLVPTARSTKETLKMGNLMAREYTCGQKGQSMMASGHKTRNKALASRHMETGTFSEANLIKVNLMVMAFIHMQTGMSL